MRNFYSIAKKWSLITTVILFTWIILAGGSGFFPQTHELLVLGFAVAFGVLIVAVIFSNIVLHKIEAMLVFFYRAFVEFLNDHLTLNFLRKVTGVGKEAIIEGCEHTNYSLPPFLKQMHTRYAKLRKQHKGDEEIFRKMWKQESDRLISIFNKNYAFSGQTMGGGAVGLTNFSVDYTCRLCSARREGEGGPIFTPITPELTTEEIERIAAEPRSPTAVEKTMKNVEGAFKSFREGLKYKFVEKVFIVIAAVSMLSAVGLVFWGQSLVDPSAWLITVVLIGCVFVFSLLTLSTVLTISRLREAFEFYSFAHELWVDEHNEVAFLRRVIGVGDETPLIEPCPHLARDNLRNLLVAMGSSYAELKKRYKKDEATLRELWKDEKERLFKLHGLNYTFASRRAVESPGSVRFVVVYGCRDCLDKVYGKGRFDATRYLLAQQGGWRKGKEGAWVSPPTTTETEEVF